MIIELLLISGGASLLLERLKPKRHQKPTDEQPPSQPSPPRQRLLADHREEHQLTLDPEIRRDFEEAGKNLNRDLALYAAGLGVALLAPYSLIFAGLTVALVVGLSLPAVAVLIADIKAGRYLTLYSMGAVGFLALVIKGHFMVLIVGGIIGNLFFRMMKRAEDGAHRQLVDTFRQHPARVWVEQDGTEIEVDFDSLKPGDIVVVNAGEVIPVDGLILSGIATVDQQVLTGESQPVERSEGEQVFATTLLLAGRVRIEVQTAGDDTVAGRIGGVLEDTQHYKENLIARGRQIAEGFLPITLGIAALTWPLLGSTAAVSVLFSSMGMSMALLGPVSVLIHLQLLSRAGILVKDGRVLETLRDIDTVIFDKTGTLTLEQPQVGAIHLFGEYDEASVLRLAAAAEFRQSHPIARAILARARELHLTLPELDEASYQVGYGIRVQIDQQRVQVGSALFMQREGISLPDPVATLQQQAGERGVSLVYVAVDGQLAGILELEPTIRPEVARIVAFLKHRGISLHILSGDHPEPTARLAEQLGIDHYMAGVLPGEKAARVQELRDQGRFVCFIGDGINDAIALKTAQVSMSLKGASSAATDTAQVVLMDGTLNHLEPLFEQVDAFEQSMRRNYIASVVPGVCSIAGIYLLDFRVLPVILIDNLGALAGMGNALWPLRNKPNPAPTAAITYQKPPHE